MGGGSTDYDSKTSKYSFSADPKVTRRKAADYAKDDKREYTGNTSTGIKPPVGKEISTESDLVALLELDVTGSMRIIPEELIKKFSTLYGESNAVMQGYSLEELKAGKKVENKLEIAVIAIGDAMGDQHSIQVVDFSKGKELITEVNKIYPEGHGGGNLEESYDLGAYFILNHCKTPNVKKPLLIIAGDEGLYPKVRADWVKKLIGDKLDSDLDTKEMMKELTGKFDTYIIRPETYYTEGQYAGIHKQWEELLGAQRVYKLNIEREGTESKEEWVKRITGRVIDCAITISSYHANNLETGIDVLKRRQDPKQVKEVLDALHPLLGKDEKK